jgi:hypothetical protein
MSDNHNDGNNFISRAIDGAEYYGNSVHTGSFEEISDQRSTIESEATDQIDETDKTDSLEYENDLDINPEKLPEILIQAGELDRICDEAEHALSMQPNVYQRGNLICFCQKIPETNDLAIKPLSKPALLRRLSLSALWLRFNEKDGEEKVCDPPDRINSSVFDAQHYPHLKPLAGIARQPYLRPDDSLVTEAGYDEQTKLLATFEPERFPAPENVTKEDALGALNKLKTLIAEFSFVSEFDRAAALCAILTAAVRPSLPVAPMFHVKAPQVSSGKSYLCSVIAAFTGDAIPPASSFPTTEEEAQKFLLATFLESPACLIFDNMTTDIYPYRALCSALTEPYLSGRILGVSKTATVGTATLVLSSGNNVSPIKDMTRRCVPIHLDPKMEIPAQKQYVKDPLKLVRARRGEFVSAALTIILGWIQAGRPMTEVKSLASYDRWSHLTRQPLLWLGMEDPATRLFSQLEHDPDREYLGQLLNTWYANFGSTPKMVRDVVHHANGYILGSQDSARGDLKEALLEQFDEKGDINRKRLGWWLSRKQGQVVAGLRFEETKGSFSSAKWAVRKASEG